MHRDDLKREIAEKIDSLHPSNTDLDSDEIRTIGSEIESLCEGVADDEEADVEEETSEEERAEDL